MATKSRSFADRSQNSQTTRGSRIPQLARQPLSCFCYQDQGSGIDLGGTVSFDQPPNTFIPKTSHKSASGEFNSTFIFVLLNHAWIMTTDRFLFITYRFLNVVVNILYFILDLDTAKK